MRTIRWGILGRGRCPSTGEGAVRTSRVMDAILADYRAGMDWAGRTAGAGRS